MHFWTIVLAVPWRLFLENVRPVGRKICYDPLAIVQTKGSGGLNYSSDDKYRDR